MEDLPLTKSGCSILPTARLLRVGVQLPGPRFLKATAVLALASLGRGSATFVVEVREQFIGNSSLLASVGTLINAAGLTSAAPLWKDRRGGEKHQRTVVYNSFEGWR